MTFAWPLTFCLVLRMKRRTFHSPFFQGWLSMTQDRVTSNAFMNRPKKNGRIFRQSWLLVVFKNSKNQTRVNYCSHYDLNFEDMWQELYYILNELFPMRRENFLESWRVNFILYRDFLPSFLSMVIWSWPWYWKLWTHESFKSTASWNERNKEVGAWA